MANGSLVVVSGVFGLDFIVKSVDSLLLGEDFSVDSESIESRN